jgi:hypothetical protein
MKMQRQFLFLLIAIITINCYSQISFEKGYFINNSGHKINCLIKNMDWGFNPTQFNYKLSANDELKTATTKLAKEFSVNNNILKYIRSTVNIDRSTEDTDNISRNKNPIFKKEELFLKVLVEGKANLYFYENGDIQRFFYNVDNSDIEQ